MQGSQDMDRQHVGDSEVGPRPVPWQRQPLVWVGFALSALSVASFLWLFDTGQVWRSMRRLQIWVLLPGAAAIVAAFRVRALRWLLLLRPLGEVPFGKLRDVLLTGFMMNNVLPARAGELARPLLLHRVAGVSRRATLATVGMERLFDVAVLIALLSLLGLMFDVPPWTRQLGSATLALLLVLTLTVAWMAFHHRSLFWMLDRLLCVIPARPRHRILDFGLRFVDGTRSLRRPGIVVGVLACSIVIWLLETATYIVMMRGLGLDLPLWTAAFTVVVANFGIAAPSAPGYLGVFDAACMGALMALGVPSEKALSFALLLHLLLFVTVTGNGLIALWRLGLRHADLRAGSQGPRRGTDQ